MVKRQTQYLVRRRNKTIIISKADLKKRNNDIALEYKTATPERRGELLSEYYDLNRSFLHFFPNFDSERREELTNILITKLPMAFAKWNPKKKIDINSYVGMFSKHHALREYMESLNAVRYARWLKDEKGNNHILRSVMIHMDAMESNPASSGASESGDESPAESAMNYFLGRTVFREHLEGCRDGAEEFLEGQKSYVRYFTGKAREVVEDLENGLVINEIFEKRKFSSITVLKSIIAAIRLQLARILTEEGRDVQFITRTERGHRWRAAEARGARRVGAPKLTAADYIRDRTSGWESYQSQTLHEGNPGGNETPEDEGTQGADESGW